MKQCMLLLVFVVMFSQVFRGNAKALDPDAELWTPEIMRSKIDQNGYEHRLEWSKEWSGGYICLGYEHETIFFGNSYVEEYKDRYDHWFSDLPDAYLDCSANPNPFKKDVVNLAIGTNSPHKIKAGKRYLVKQDLVALTDPVGEVQINGQFYHVAPIPLTDPLIDPIYIACADINSQYIRCIRAYDKLATGKFVFGCPPMDGLYYPKNGTTHNSPPNPLVNLYTQPLFPDILLNTAFFVDATSDADGNPLTYFMNLTRLSNPPWVEEIPLDYIVDTDQFYNFHEPLEEGKYSWSVVVKDTCSDPSMEGYDHPGRTVSKTMYFEASDFTEADCTDNDGDEYGIGPDCLKEDCNDFDATVHPGADEVCGDGVDNDCLDGDTVCPWDCTDSDGDGYGVGADCLGPDCDDGNATIHDCIYSCQWHTQDPNGAVTLSPGAQRDVVVSYTNTGNLAWRNNIEQFPGDTILLVSCDITGHQVPSYLVHPSWQSSEVIGTFIKENQNGDPVEKVSPGENAWWKFRIKVPQDAPEGQKRVYFRPYHATGGFIENWSGMHFVINIKKGVSRGEMVFVPAGKFVRGACNESMTENGGACSPGDLGYDEYAYNTAESPVREITLDAYWIDKTEVTVAAYRDCMNAGGCFLPHTLEPYAGLETCHNWWSETGRDNHPMVCASYAEVWYYCDWVGKRLPTEAEWEKASRGGCEISADPNVCEPGIDDGRYPWGNETPDCDRANYYDSYGDVYGECVGQTMPVGSYPTGASPYGALDMAGNVWEWVWDSYHASYYQPDFGALDYSPDNNPQGPAVADDFHTVLRGGSLVNADFDGLRSAYRNYGGYNHYTDYTYPFIGFRCAKSQ